MKLCGIEINCLTYKYLLHQTIAPALVVTVNAEAIVRAQSDSKLFEIINSSVTTIDGQIPLWLFHLTYPTEKIEKISGSDLIYVVSDWAKKRDKRIFLLGGRQRSNNAAVDNLKKLYVGLQVEGFSPEYSPYPFVEEIEDQIKVHIHSFKPHVLFVAFGMGKQEFWEYDNLDWLKNEGVELIIGCGGTFEFVSGQIKRAPKFVQSAGLEGFWRLFQEFKWFRIKRIMVSCKIFYYYVKYHLWKFTSD